MPDNDKLITLDNLGTFKDNIEEEIREGSLNTLENIVLSSGPSGTLDSETLNKLKAHPAHYMLSRGDGYIYYFTIENQTELQYDFKLIVGSVVQTTYIVINKTTGAWSTGTTGPELVEVVPYQTTSPLTYTQVEKAKAGKLAVLDDNQVFVLFSKDSSTVTFAAYTVSYQNGYYSQACYTLRQQNRVLTISSRMFTQASFTEYRMVADIVEDFIGNTDTPNASGKQVVRALNLRRTQDMLTPNVYDATATYAVGDVVIYQNQLYRCTTAIETAEAWDSTHWELTNAVELAKEKGANIVEIASTGVQTEEMGAKIEAADGLNIRGYIYLRTSVNSNFIEFTQVRVNQNYTELNEKYAIYYLSSRDLISGTHDIPVIRRERIVNTFSASASYVPGDFVYYNNLIYRCVTAHTGAWSSSDFTQVVLADEIHSDIVTITATGVQSDAMAAKIENAKALYFQDVLYVKTYKDSTDDYFDKYGLSTAYDSGAELKYRRSTKTLTVSNQTYNKVATIGGAYGTVGVDASLTTAGSLPTSRSIGLTGKLPYLTTAPTADNTSGFLTIVVLPSEPDTRYSGYMYVITGSNS